MLSESQEEFIKREIDSSSVELATLKDDLFDHFCCSIEIEMKGGKSFEDAYKTVYQAVCPNGLEEIERETFFLLNLKKILFMKKFMYSLGLLTTISTSIGWLFKILHWPGGGDLFIRIFRIRSNIPATFIGRSLQVKSTEGPLRALKNNFRF
jgi:hypothetical protein